MKKLRYFIFVLFTCCFSIPLVFASASDITQIASAKDLENCFNTNGICKLTKNITVDDELSVIKDVILDLNGNTIKPSTSLSINGGFINIKRGAKLTINDTKGNGIITTNNGNNKVWAAIQLAKDPSSEKLSELVVNNGTIEGYYYGIVGNGKNHNTKITINSGTIKTLNNNDSVGIYNPQEGEVIINNGTIKGATGIEIRSGSLTINNGTIQGIAPTFTKTVNSNGSTINGAGISIAQHTTKKPINVTINNGNISGQYALYEWNPHNNNQADLDKIKIHINGGNFRTLIENGKAIYSQNFKNFISGGSFNTSVSEYLTDDANITSGVMGEEKIKDDDSNKNLGIIIISVLILSPIGYIIYKKAI